MKKINLPLCLFVLLAGFFQTVSLNAQTNYDDTPVKGNFIGVYTPEQSYVKGNTIFEADPVSISSEWDKSGFSLTQDQVVATGTYQPNAELYLISPAVRLPEIAGVQKLFLEINDKFHTESDCDYVSIRISKDDGQSWKQLYRSSGTTGWRVSQLNLSAYAGQTVILSFALTSDESIQGTGWDISKIGIYSSSVTVPLFKSAFKNQIASIEIINVHTQSYPEAVFFDIIPRNNLGDFISGLDFQDFTAYDNNLQVSKCFDVYENSLTQRQALDVVFLIDNSGSMADDQSNVAANLVTMVDKLNLQGYDVRLAMVRFGQTANNGYAIVVPNPSQSNTAFLTNTDDFINLWNSVNTAYGGYEPAYCTIVDAVNSPLISFREYSEKIFVLITDENITTYGNSCSGATMSSAIAAMNSKGIRLYTVSGNDVVSQSDFEPLCTATNGEWYGEIRGDYSHIFDNITESLSGKYTIKICPELPMDPVDPDICIPLSIEVQGNSAIGDATCYTVKPTPRLVRTPDTQAKDGVAQDEGVSISLGVEVIDGPNVDSVALYYRIIDNSIPPSTVPFRRTATVPTSMNFYGTIPGALVEPYSIEYYFVAYFSDHADVVSPTETQDYFAWTLPVKPNYAPYIRDVIAPTEVAPCRGDIIISATVTDTTDSLKTNGVTLYYKTTDALNLYTRSRMKKTSPTSDVYKDTIPGSAVRNPGVSYYIMAEDNHGTQGWYGTEENPKTIDIASNIPSSTLGGQAVSRTSMALAMTLMQTNYYLDDVVLDCGIVSNGDQMVIKFYYTNDCGQLQEGWSYNYTRGVYQNLYVYLDDPSTPYKDGYHIGERLYIRVIYNGKEYDVNFEMQGVDFDIYFQHSTAWLIYGFEGKGTPGVEIYGNNILIAANDDTPDAADGTDFGSQVAAVTQTFAIENTGCADLHVTDIKLADAVNFEVQNTTLPLVIPQGAIQYFDVEYKATANAETILSVFNNAKNPYNFKLRGAVSTGGGGIDCGISVYPNPMSLSNYGAFVAFDVAVTSEVSVYVFNAATGLLHSTVLQPTTLNAGRHTYYISKTGMVSGGMYLVVVNIGAGNCADVLIVQ